MSKLCEMETGKTGIKVLHEVHIGNFQQMMAIECWLR